MGLGIIMGGIAGAGEGAGKAFAETQKAHDEESLMRERAGLETEKAKVLAQYQNDLQNAPAIAAGGYMKDAASQQIPITAPPVTQLSGNDPNSGYVPTAGQAEQEAANGSAGKGLDPSKTPDLIARIQALPDDNPDKAPMLAQLERQRVSDQKAAQDAVAGQGRAPTTQEALQQAIKNATANGDARSVEWLKKLAGDKYIPVPYGGVMDTQTGEIKGQQTYKTDIVDKQEAGKTQRTEANNQTKRDIARENNETRSDVAKAKLAGQYPEANSIPQTEKDVWVHQFITNGSLSRNAPPVARLNIATWLAEKGITSQDVDSGVAQRKYDLATAVTAGHRGGAMKGVEEALPALAANALDLSQKLDQGAFVPLNKLMQMSESNISDPALSAFRVAHQALASEYQQVISRGGTGSVEALKEAMHVLNSAQGPEAYGAAIGQVLNELKINVDGQDRVRSKMGGGHSAEPSRTLPPLSVPHQNIQPVTKLTPIPSGWSVKEH